jgi:AcrR family transcriptional regulator
MTKTETWIIDSLLELMANKPYEQITVRDVTNRVGIVRQSFYRYFQSKEEVLNLFLEHCFPPDSLAPTTENAALVSLETFVRHAPALKTILTSTVAHIVFDYVNRWEEYHIGMLKKNLAPEEAALLRYRIKFRNAGTTRVICDWISSGMPVGEEKVAALLKEMTA